jgi:lipoprotein-anchoring transpeptidase ErfK/SrfK
MGPKTKVFDIWGNSMGNARFNYAPATAVPLTGPFFNDFARPAKKSSPKSPPPEAEPPQEEAVPHVRLNLWKSAVTEIRGARRQDPGEPPKESKNEEEPEKTSSPLWKRWYVIGPAALAVTTLTGLAFFIFPLHRSLAPVYLGNIRVTPNNNSAQIQKHISTASAGYELALKDVSGKVSKYPLNQTGVSIDAKKSAALIKSEVEPDWLGRLTWWKPIRLPLATNTDKNLLQKFLHESVIKPDTPYKNASLEINGSEVNIVKEAAGKGQSEENPYINLPAKVAALDKTPIVLRQLTIPAPIKTYDLADEKAKLEAILNQKIVLHIDSATITPKPGDIAAWLDISPVEHSKTIDISVNSGKVQSYLDKVARPYVQPPRSRLVMTQTDGSTTVLDPGSNGIDIVNKDKAASSIAAQVLATKGLEQTLDIDYATFKTVEVQPYEKWIVVDTTSKRMYAYEQSTLVHSFLVSAGAPQTPTVTGQFAIYSKFRTQDMRGNNADGSRYFQPNVEWVSYFYKDYAVHGNYWRPASWFGNINSSHGCVGVVNPDAQWIYDWAPIGTPVIVHK